MKAEAESKIADPFSDHSGYGNPDIFVALLDEYEKSPQRSGTPEVELTTRVALHTSAKAAQVQRHIAAQAARRLFWATVALAFSTVVLAVATIVLCVITAKHGA